MYVESSFQHADTIGRILNLKTGHVSPQFHVVYDERFTTAIGTVPQSRILDQELWDNILDFKGHSNYLDEDYRENPAVQARIQDLFDTSANDVKPRSPAPEGEVLFSPCESGTFDPPNEVQSTMTTDSNEGDVPEYSTRYGR